jgi:hypothetical protein
VNIRLDLSLRKRFVPSVAGRILWKELVFKLPNKENRMSVQDVREKIQKLSASHPKDFRIIRSAQEVDRIDLANADMHGPFDNSSSQITSTLEAALGSGKQAAVQAAGSDQILVFTERGSRLFR